MHHARSYPMLTMLLVCTLTALEAGEPSLAELQQAAPVTGGLVLHLGVSDGSLGVALAQAHPVVVFAITADVAIETRVRQAFATAGVHGQATVAGFVHGRVPLTDDSAAVTIADLDALPGLSEAEALRVTRPFGRLWLRQGGRWRSIDKPRPSGADDWGQYHYDATMSDRSRDSLAGAAQGIQWITGPQRVHNEGVRIFGSVALLQDRQRTLIARDAFTGLPLWQRSDLAPWTRFTLIAHGERVYIHPRHDPRNDKVPGEAMLALDIRTGETVTTYSEGITFVPPEGGWPRDGRHPIFAERNFTSRDLQARVTDDGKLLQIGGRQMVMLDAASGRRLWAATAAEGQMWCHPIISEGSVFVVEGGFMEARAYTHWPMAGVQRIHCLDPATGEARWIYTPPADRDVMAASNMSQGAGRLALTGRQRGAPSPVCMLILDSATGREAAFLPTGISADPNRPWSMASGHSGVRGNIIGDRLHLSGIGTLPGSISVTNPVPETIERPYARISSPINCTLVRYSENLIFNSLTVFQLDGGGIQHTNAARTTCDVGAFPANGLAYITPNHCFCLPFLPGSIAFHPRTFAGEEALTRLETGPARPAARPLLTNDTSAWPMFLGNNQRGAWVDDPLPPTVRQLWHIKPAGETDAAGLLATAWRDHWYAHGPITQASVVDGSVVVGISHRQQIAAFDAATGTERWRTSIDGRIDTAPTIAGGLVVAGTRNGWVYALDLANGQLAWRFFAAPRRDRILVDGQPESVWPLFGTLNVTEDGVWAVAGRHSDNDAGLWWWRLDLATGAARAQGRLGPGQLYDTTRRGGIMSNPVVLDRNLFQLPGATLQIADGTLQEWTHSWKPAGRWNEWDGWYERFTRGVLTPGTQGILAEVGFLGGYKLSQYGMASGRLFVHKGDEFAAVGGSPFPTHRGGDGNSTLRRMRRLPEITTIETPDSGNPTRINRRQVGNTVLWEHPDQGPAGIWRGEGLGALAMAGDTLVLGGEVSHKDEWRHRQVMAFRLRLLHEATGEARQDDLPLTAKPIYGGISSDDGRIFVVTQDGRLTAFGR